MSPFSYVFGRYRFFSFRDCLIFSFSSLIASRLNPIRISCTASETSC